MKEKDNYQLFVIIVLIDYFPEGEAPTCFVSQSTNV